MEKDTYTKLMELISKKRRYSREGHVPKTEGQRLAMGVALKTSRRFLEGVDPDLAARSPFYKAHQEAVDYLSWVLEGAEDSDFEDQEGEWRYGA